MKKNVSSILKHLYLLILLFLIVFPIIYTVASSFKTNSEILAHPANIFPKEPTLDNYIQAWNSDNFRIGKMLFNSLYYTLFNVVITVGVSAMCGYVFARGHFRGKNTIFTIFCALLFVNIGSISMYPNFQILELLHIPRSLPGLLFVKCFGIPVANIYLVRGFINGIPKEIDEAAKIDGCGFTRIFFSIIIHLITPILATVAIMTFQGSWNDYLMPLIFTMTKPEQRTLIVGVVSLKTSGEAASSWNLMLAGTTLALIPVLVAYAIGNKYFVQGLAAGAVKG